MPPLCAPSSHHLLAEPAPSAAASPDENEDDGRAEMVASLVTALADAAAAEENNNAQSPEQQHRLALQAYNSLCFDFPIVPANALGSLAIAFRSSSLDTGAPVFPTTDKFTSGLRYLVSIEFTNQSLSNAVAATEDGSGKRAGEPGGDRTFRCDRVFELCGCVFLLAPARRLAEAHNDGGASLQAFLAMYNPLSTDLVEQLIDYDDGLASITDLDDNSRDGVGTSELEYEVRSTLDDKVATEMDNDNSDWEDMGVSTAPAQRVISEESTNERNVEKVAWPDVMDKVAHLIGSVPPEVINSGVWGELQLTEHLIQALDGLKMLERLEVEAVVGPAKLYADLLSDHLLSSWSTSASDLSRVLSSLMALVDFNGDIKQRTSSKAEGKEKAFTWNAIYLSTLAKVCARVSGYPPQTISPNRDFAPTFEHSTSNGITKQSSLPSSTFIRNLWQSVFSNLHFLEVQLTESQGKGGSSSQLELLLWILCFMVKFAPGNTDFRAILLEGGIFRTALQLFLKAGGDPQMESLRRFLLLSMASSSSLAEFAAKVPSFTTTMSAIGQGAEESYAKAHAAIWPLILRAASRQSSSGKTLGRYSNSFEARDVEGTLIAAFDGVVEAVADVKIKANFFSLLNKVVWLRVLLTLLGDAASASSTSTFRLWENLSPLDVSIGRCQAALGSLLVHMTDKASISSPRPIAHQKKSDELEEDNAQSSDDSNDTSVTKPICEEPKDRIAFPSTARGTELLAAKEELKELLPSLLLQLKVLSALTKENCNAKID